MAAAHQAARHVGSHLAQPNHSQLHFSSPRKEMPAPAAPGDACSAGGELMRSETLAQSFLDCALQRTKSGGEIGAEMHSQCTASAFREHLEVPSRLRCLHDSEGVFLSRHRKILRVVARQLQENARIWTAFVRLS